MARALYNRALQIDANNTVTNYQLGNLYHETVRREGHPCRPPAHCCVGVCQLRLGVEFTRGIHQGNNELAIKSFEQALVEDDNTKTPVRVLTNKATLHYKMDEFGKSEEAFKRALSVSPAAAAALQHRENSSHMCVRPLDSAHSLASPQRAG